MKNYMMIAGAALMLASCTTVKKTYTIYPKSGTQTQGTASFRQKGAQVEMDINAYKLSPGIHAVHIHEKGDCSATDASSAGGHWNPSKDDHGKWGAEHFHMGDIGNLVADKNGTARLIFSTNKWCMGCSDDSRNIYGHAIVIHEKADDFHTQPTGNAGGRVGCVEIK